jgi:hypothetical protein
VGVEAQSCWGVFGGVGMPWPVYLPVMAYSGREGVVSSDLRLGYNHALTEQLSLRGLVLSAWVYEWGDPCSDGCTSHEHKFFNFLSLGLRYQFPCGVLAGVQVPLVAAEFSYGREPDDTGWHHPEWFPPPVSAAFTQAYVGYSWKL